MGPRAAALRREATLLELAGSVCLTEGHGILVRSIDRLSAGLVNELVMTPPNEHSSVEGGRDDRGTRGPVGVARGIDPIQCSSAK